MRISLRWRIAAAYALLLVVVLILTSGVIVWRLNSILYDAARARVDVTMNEIAQASQVQNPFGDPIESFAQLFSSANLAGWESPETFIQVDNADGYPVARTANLGASSIPKGDFLSAAHDTAYRQVTLAGRPFLVEDRLLRSANAAAIVHVAEPLDALTRTFDRVRYTIVVILIFAAIAVIVLSALVASQALGPITKLSRAMHDVGSDRLDVRLEGSDRQDEIGDLTASFNDLLSRLGEAFARERQFISDASHELKTPLTSINANAQLLMRWGDRDEAVRLESLRTIANESASLAEMVNGMLTLAKADRGDAIALEPLSLAHVANEAVKSSSPRAAEKHVALTFTHAGTPLVEGNEHLLRQLIGNLIDNAIKFTTEGGVHVRVGSDESHAWVEVADTGPGIAEDELGQIFERFYRADRARSRDVPGTGLGLAIVRSIARVHKGTVVAERAPEGGALFRATFEKLPETLTESS